jgi:hypothetical protein
MVSQTSPRCISLRSAVYRLRVPSRYKLKDDPWVSSGRVRVDIACVCSGQPIPFSATCDWLLVGCTSFTSLRGYNIGTRLIEDFLSRTTLPRCTDFTTQTAEILSKVGFKAFLNITPLITYPPLAPGGPQEFGLVLEENPLSEMVELPGDAVEGGLWFSQVLCGVVRGALEMVQLQVECYFVSDVLRGDEQTEMRVRLVKFADEEVPISDE